MTLFSLVKIKTHLRFCRKSSGECVGALCFSRKLIHLCRSAATTIIGSAVTIQAARSLMWRVDFRVVAAAFDSGAYRHAEAGRTPIEPKCKPAPAFAFWRGRAAEWTRPAACGGTRNMELARTRRARKSLEGSMPTSTPQIGKLFCRADVHPQGVGRIRSAPYAADGCAHHPPHGCGGNRRLRADSVVHPHRMFLYTREALGHPPPIF